MASASLARAEKHLAEEEVDEGLAAAEDALSSYRGASDKTGVADALRLVLRLRGLQGTGEEVVKAAKDELEAFQKTGDQAGAAKMTLTVAQLTLGKGDDRAKCAEAQALADSALQLFRGQGDKKMEAATLLVLNAALLGKSPGAKWCDEAKKMCDDAVPLLRELGDLGGEAAALHGIARARLKSGAADGALRVGEEALALFQKAKLRKQEANELHWIAKVHLQEGDAEEAVSYADEALDIFNDDLHATAGEADVMETLVKAYIKKGEPRAALKVTRDELERFEESGNKKLKVFAMEMKLHCYYSMGNLERARRTANMALETLEDADDLEGQAAMLRTISRLSMEVGEFDKALRAGQEALSMYEEVGDDKEQAATLQLRSSIFLANEQYDKALNVALEAKEMYQDLQDAKGEATSLLQVSNVQFVQGDLKAAASSATQALTKFSQLGEADEERSALIMLSNTHMKGEEWELALRTLGQVLPIVRDAGEKEEVVRIMVVMVRAQLMIMIEKARDGKGTAKAFTSGAEQVMKTVKESLSMAKKTGDVQCVGMAMFQAAQVHMLQGKLQESMKMSADALTKFRDAGDLRSEAATLILRSDCLLWSRELKDARESAEEAVWVCQQIGDADGEGQAWSQLDRAEREEAEERSRKQQMLQQQVQMQQMPAQMQLKPIDFSNQGSDEPHAAASTAATFQMAKVDKLDLTGGISAEQVTSTIQKIAKGLTGSEEDIEVDTPLMESGLTSNTAVLLRDQLSENLPGIKLPHTLMFDYPSIGAVADLVVEQAEKNAKKALK